MLLPRSHNFIKETITIDETDKADPKTVSFLICHLMLNIMNELLEHNRWECRVLIGHDQFIYSKAH